MRTAPLGRSGLMVSQLCLGTMIFGEDSPRSIDEPTAIRMIDQFLEAGGNFVDTADVYAGGRSEEIVGKALKGRRSRVVLATKVRHRSGDSPNDVGLSRHHILAACEASLRRLGTDYIDLLYAHQWDPLTPIDETLRAFDDLVTAGKYRRGDRPGQGRIATTPDEAEEAWHRRATERNWRIIDAVGEVAEARDKSYAQVALAWLLAQPAVTAPIVGARTPGQLADNLGATGWQLSEEELARLDKAAAIEEGYPYRMLRVYGDR